MNVVSPGRISLLLVCGSFSLGGSERNVLNIAAGLDPARFRVTVLGFSGDGPLRAQLEARGIPVAVVGWSFDPRRLWVEYGRLRDRITEVAPDVIHLFNYPTVYFGVAAGVEAGVPVRVVAIQAYDTWKGWTEWIVDRILRRAVTLYLADGDGTRRFAMRQQGLPAGQVKLLYDGPDLDGLSPSVSRATMRRQLGLAVDRPVVGLVGRLQDAHKGQSVFLASVARIPLACAAQFVLVGGGSDEPMLRRRAEDLGLGARVVFTGPQLQLAEVLNALDVLVIPSLQYESVPKILLEGMAAGCSIVASRMGDIPEFLEHGVTGLLVEPGDAASLAAAIQRLLARPDEAKALGERARGSLVSRGITLRQSLAALADTYRDLAGAGGRPIGGILRKRARLAMATYRMLRLGDERIRWLLTQGPWRRR
jgi:glycosyltransferase involved in cell wall biosynthesis